MKRINFVILLTICLGLTSCGKDQLEKDRETIEDYLISQNLTADVTDEGVYYIIEESGNSQHPVASSFITIHYSGYFLNGEVFDSSIDNGEPLEIAMFKVIQGWRIGIQLFGKGGKGKLIIPSGLAYGEDGYSGIPANAILVFDIELIDFI